MKQRIYKYPLRINGGGLRESQRIDLPAGARILSVGVQNDRGVFWADVDPSAPLTSRLIHVALTGDPTPRGTFVGSLLFDDGDYVVHVFDDREAEVTT